VLQAPWYGSMSASEASCSSKCRCGPVELPELPAIPGQSTWVIPKGSNPRLRSSAALR